MSDSTPPSTPDGDANPRLPERRAEGSTPRSPADEPAGQISLEEMMERLQRSGSGSGSGSGESRSGRRRRSSSSSSSSSSQGSGSGPGSGRRSSSSSGSGRRGSSSGGQEDYDSREPQPSYRAAEAGTLPMPKAVLPPPRRQDADATAFKERRNISSPGRKSKWLLYSVIGLVLLAALVWLGIRMLNRWRIEGEGFRINAARRVSELLDRPVTFSRFRQAGSDQLTLSTFNLVPSRQDLLNTAALTDLTAELAAGSLLADDWSLRSLRIKKADFSFLPEKPLNEQTMYQSRQTPVDRGEPPNTGFRIGLTSDPVAVDVETGRFDELNLSWPGPGGQPESLTRMEGNFRVVDQSVQVEIIGGLLDTASWPPFPVRQLNAKLTGTALEIVSARLGFTAEHEVRVSGSADLVPEGKIELKADIGQILLKHIVPDAWAFSVLGTFESNGASWVSSFKSGPPALLTGPIRVRGLVLRNLPFVDKIASLLRRPELALMEFPTLTGEFAWSPGPTRISNLSAVTEDGLLRFTGDLTVTPGEAISGTLTFEANEAYFAGVPAGTETGFIPSQEGWRALAVTLGGRENALTDDIGIANPVIIKGRQGLPGAPGSPANPAPVPVPATSLEGPRMTLPPGVSAPAPARAPATAPAPAAAPRAAVPAAPVPARPKPSDAELERGFNELLGR